MYGEKATDFNINGQWVGYYINISSRGKGRDPHDHTFPVTAFFSLSGDQLNGAMIDEVTDFETPYEVLVDSQAEDMDEEAKRSAALLATQYPNLIIESSLPPESELKGTVNGMQITFTKQYLGRQKSYVNTGEKRIPVPDASGHQLEYSGILNPEKAAIVGTWIIFEEGVARQLRKPNAKGTFKLYKKV